MSAPENENPDPSKTPKRVRLTEQAADLITGQRQEDYGPPVKNFQRIANLWNDHMETDIFTPRKVAELMLLLKMARTVNSPTEDSYLDAIGYAAIAGELADLELKNAKTPKEVENISYDKYLYDKIADGSLTWDEVRAELGYKELAEDPEIVEKHKARQEWVKYTRETGGDGK